MRDKVDIGEGKVDGWESVVVWNWELEEGGAFVVVRVEGDQFEGLFVRLEIRVKGQKLMLERKSRLRLLSPK